MSSILILGGYGYTGRLLARHLLQENHTQISLAGRNLEKAQLLASRLNEEFAGNRVEIVHADAGDAESLRAAFSRADMVIVASPTTQHAKTVARAALEANIDYMDLQLGAQKFAVLQTMAEEITQAGLCFITEAGFHPGLPSALVRFAATQFDKIHTTVTAGYLNMGHNLPYSEAVDELMEAFKDFKGQVYRNGKWTRPGSFDLRKINFGGDIGLRTCYSMFFEELRSLPEMFPALGEVGFYIAGTNWLLDWVISMVVMAGLKIAPKRSIRPMGKLMWWGMQNLPGPPYLVALKVEATGEKDGELSKVEIIASHPDGYEFTAIPVVACLLQYLEGCARRSGLWMMGHLVEPVRLFQDMQRMGVKVTEQIS